MLFRSDGNRFSPLDQINKANVTRLAPRWTYAMPNASRLAVTPLVVDGIMYVTTANECHALDAGTGRRIWTYRRLRTKGLAGDAAGGTNRGVAVAGEQVFMVTDHAHIFALEERLDVRERDEPEIGLFCECGCLEVVTVTRTRYEAAGGAWLDGHKPK